MSECDLERGKLAAYLDGELSEAQVPEARTHIAACPVCAAEIADSVALKRSLRAARGHYSPRPELRAQVRQKTAKKSKRQRPRWIPVTLEIAAAMLVALVTLKYAPQRTDAMGEVADLHVSMLASANPVDVVSTDRHTVKPWFAGRIPFAFNLPEFAGSDFALLGGKVAYFDQQPGAELLVSTKQHKMSVLIFKESAEMKHAFSGTKKMEARNGFEMETWSSGELRFVVTGDTEPASIDKLAGMMRQANP